MAQAILNTMHCPFCQNSDTKVVDTRISDDGHSIRRRRECPKCSKRFTTLETTMLLVVKRSGNVEQFDRNKVISGVRKACQGRPIKEDDLKAYMRFASVYQNFENLGDFQNAINELKADALQ